MNQNKNIVLATDAGEYNYRPYLVMELLQGANLKAYVTNNYHVHASNEKDLPPSIRKKIDIACSIILQAASGLSCAHKAGIIHRDIKPANLWITDDNTVKVLDLGLAQTITGDKSSSPSGGTPGYMSPEQCEGKDDIDLRADIYSLGCVFFFLLSGQKPLSYTKNREDLNQPKMNASRELPFPMLRSIGIRVPQRLQAIITKMTAFNPEDRYSSMEEVSRDIYKFRKSYCEPTLLARLRIPFIFTLFLSIVMGGWYYFSYLHVYNNYYADYVERWGVPEGIFPLTEEQISCRQYHYRFETKAGKVIRLVHANSAGTPKPVDEMQNMECLEWSNRPMIAEYHYEPAPKDPLKDLSYVVYKNRTGTETIKYTYSFGARNDFMISSRMATDELISINVNAENSMSEVDIIDLLFPAKILHCHIICNEHGFREKMFFCWKDSTPAINDDGIKGLQYELDNNGRVEKLLCIDENSIIHDKYGIAKRVYKYDLNGNIEWITCTDINDNPVPTKNAWSTAHRQYDIHGNCIETSFSVKTSEPNSENTFKINYRYDAKGNMTEEAYWSNKTPVAHPASNIAKLAYRYNEHGDLVSVSCYRYDENEKKYIPCLCKDGYASFVAICDEFGIQKESRYFGLDGLPCLRKEKNAITLLDVNDKGKVISQWYKGLDGELCCVNGGYAGFTCEYDPETGQFTKCSFRGKDRTPCINTNTGYAICTYDYHPSTRQLTSISFWDSSGKLMCNNTDGVAKYTIENKEGKCYVIQLYNHNDELIEENYYDLDKTPYWKRSIERLSNGDIMQKIYCSPDDNTSVYETCYLYEYPQPGVQRIKSKTFYDEKGELCSGSCIVRFRYKNIEEFGNEVACVEEAFDKNEKLLRRLFKSKEDRYCSDKNGVSIYDWQYDSSGRKKICYYLDMNEHPIENINGITQIVWLYNSSLFDETIPVLRKKIDLQGRCVESRFYCAENEKEQYKNRFGIYGHNIEYSFDLSHKNGFLFREKMVNIGRDGLPASDIYGVRYIISLSDKNEIIINRMCYDKNNKVIKP